MGDGSNDERGVMNIDWNSEAMQMVMDTIDLEWDYPHSEAVGMAEALCAKRLGWY